MNFQGVRRGDSSALRASLTGVRSLGRFVAMLTLCSE